MLLDSWYCNSRIISTTVVYTHTPVQGLPRWPGMRKVKPSWILLNFTEATDSEWQWHQLGHMQVCTSLQTDNHASTPPLSFLQAGCPSCRPTTNVESTEGFSTLQQVLREFWLKTAVQGEPQKLLLPVGASGPQSGPYMLHCDFTSQTASQPVQHSAWICP